MGAAGALHWMADTACAVGNLKSNASENIFLLWRWSREVGRPFLTAGMYWGYIGMRKEGRTAEEERKFIVERILLLNEVLQSARVGSVWPLKWLAGAFCTEVMVGDSSLIQKPHCVCERNVNSGSPTSTAVCLLRSQGWTLVLLLNSSELERPPNWIYANGSETSHACVFAHRQCPL